MNKRRYTFQVTKICQYCGKEYCFEFPVGADLKSVPECGKCKRKLW